MLLIAIISIITFSYWFLEDWMVHLLQMTPDDLVSINMTALANLASTVHCQIYFSGCVAHFSIQAQMVNSSSASYSIHFHSYFKSAAEFYINSLIICQPLVMYFIISNFLKIPLQPQMCLLHQNHHIACWFSVPDDGMADFLVRQIRVSFISTSSIKL